MKKRKSYWFTREELDKIRDDFWLEKPGSNITFSNYLMEEIKKRIRGNDPQQ